LTPAGGGPLVTAVVLYSSATLTATLVPSYPLGYSKTYVAKADTTIRSLDQQPLAAPVTWSFTTTGKPVTKRVNSGGPAYLSPSTAASYMADTPVSGSLTMSGGYSRTSGAFVTDTDDPGLYVDERYGVFVQNIIVPNGTYDVRLHFAETQGASPGRRIFSMDVTETSGTDVPYLDVAAVVGQRRALVKTIPNVVVTLGAVHIRSIASIGDPILSAVEVLPVVPQVTSTSPASTETGVPPSSAVSATFNRSLDPSSVSTSSFTLVAPDGSTVAADVAYDAATRTATLRPHDLLASDSTYSATIADSVTGSDGIAMASPYSWTFTTGS